MKQIWNLILLLSFTFVHAQNGKITGSIKLRDSSISFKEISITLLKECKRIDNVISNNSGQFNFIGLDSGQYEILFEYPGGLYCDKDNLVISQETIDISLGVSLPMYCIPESTKPIVCSFREKHSDNIVPIFYGHPGERELNEAKEGRMILGSCFGSKCDPHFKCLIHDVIFN